MDRHQRAVGLCAVSPPVSAAPRRRPAPAARTGRTDNAAPDGVPDTDDAALSL